jgi:hypothetical protein
MNVPVNTSLMEKLQWLQANAESNGEYTIVVTSDESIEAQTLSFPDKSNITVQLIGEGEKIISLKGKGSLFCIISGVTLILDSGVTLQGHDGNDSSLVSVEGKLIMKDGAKIKGNTHSDGGGVYVINGTFEMIGGEISGNLGYYGGGVFVHREGTFKMKGGKINGNIAKTQGGGVHVSNSSFEMLDGQISGNTAIDGGGVCVGSNANFTMKGGEISGNTADDIGGGVAVCGGEEEGRFTMENGVISCNNSYLNGGGVAVSGRFIMENGVISGNKATSSISNKKSAGGGVEVYPGNFTMNGGSIFGNIADVEPQVREEPPGRFNMIGGFVDYISTSSALEESYNNVRLLLDQKRNQEREARAKQRLAQAKQSFKEYWDSHPDDKIALESEKQSLTQQIANLNDKDIPAIPGYIEMNKLNGKINELISEKKALGIFKFKEKKAVQQQIDSINIEIESILLRINPAIAEIRELISEHKNRIKVIDTELTKPR